MQALRDARDRHGAIFAGGDVAAEDTDERRVQRGGEVHAAAGVVPVPGPNGRIRVGKAGGRVDAANFQAGIGVGLPRPGDGRRGGEGGGLGQVKVGAEAAPLDARRSRIPGSG